MKSIILGAVCGGLGVPVIFTFLRPKSRCPECGELKPTFRKPTCLRDLFLGGWRCPECRAHVSLFGKLLGD